MLDFIVDYKYIILIVLILLLAFVIYVILFKSKKVKPIDMDKVLDTKEEKTKIEEVIEALEGNSNERVTTTFEEEQEANAIISYQELVRAVNEKKANSEFKTVKKDIEVDDIEEILEDFEESAEEKTEIKEKTEVKEKPKFKNSEFISPVFGKSSTPDNFLEELKDLRKNL